MSQQFHTQGELFHIVCHAKEQQQQSRAQEDLIKDGRLSLKFDKSEVCLSVKECVDKHCLAYENRLTLDVTDMLEKCVQMADDEYLSSPNQSSDVEDSWCDFQG